MNKCEHFTCNSTTDYERVQCDNDATHRICWPDGHSLLTCEAHVIQYRDIMSGMIERGTAKVIPDFVRLEQR